MLVSVIMPTYNCGHFIEDAIKSVLYQTMNDWELIIVDDCSTDNTSAIVKPYLEQYKNILYKKLECNAGPAKARTEAIRMAKGQYVAFLDSDDIWLPEKLEKQIKFMIDTGAKFSCTSYRQMDESGRELHKVCIPPKKTDYNKMFYLSDPIGNLTVLYDQAALGKYEVPDIAKRNDYALWLKILHDVDYCYGMREVLAIYRVRSNSVSSNKLRLIKYMWHLYRKIEKMSFLKSCFGILCWGCVKTLGYGKKRWEE